MKRSRIESWKLNCAKFHIDGNDKSKREEFLRTAHVCTIFQLRGSSNIFLLFAFPKYFLSERFSGYVNYYHSDENFGFVVRDDQPEKEYHFTGADLHVDSVPKVR